MKYFGYIVCVLVTFLTPVKNEDFAVQQVTCESQINPLAVNTLHPVFGWKLQSNQEQVMQSAYQILVASSEKGLAKGHGDMWDSGKVVTDKSLYVSYDGKPLKSGKKYYWKVKLWNTKGEITDWSKAATFRMAPEILKKDTHWIGAITKADSHLPEGRHYHSATYKKTKKQAIIDSTAELARQSILLRKSFKAKRNIKEAVIYVSGLGHYELTLNGQKIGNSEFAPLWTDYDKTVLYNTYELDVNHLNKGENVIGVCLGNGMYNTIEERYTKFFVAFGPPTLFFKMKIVYDNGDEQEIVSDTSWKYSKSPITFNSLFGGEDYDARLEQPGWNQKGFKAKDWKDVVIQEAPKGSVKPQQTTPVQINEVFPVEEFKKYNDSIYVFNMGQNLSGFPTIKVKGKKGQTIRIWPAEGLKEDGTIRQGRSGKPYYYEYTLKGEGIETWQPRFTYYGYQYLQIENINYKDEIEAELPTLLEIQSNFLYNNAGRAGYFNCSNELFNKADELINNSIKSNFQSVFTDCPHREKLGWLEETHLNGPGLFYNYHLETYIRNVMQNISDAQNADGLIPTIAPEYVVFGGDFTDSPEWGVAGIILPWMYYEYYGDDSLIKEYYPVMKRYVDYLTSKSDEHIVSYGLGDWYDYGDHPAGYSKNSPIALSATSHYYYGTYLLAKAAKHLNKDVDAKKYAQLTEEIKRAFNNKFFNTKTKQYGTGSQFSNAVPLFMDMVALENREAVMNNLLADITKRGYRLTTGDVGNRYLYQVLANNGANDVMYQMQNHEDAPGYGFQIKFGLTTLTEQWDPRKGNSWNHFMMGQIQEWFFKSLGGIVPDENVQGFKHFYLQPVIVGDMSYVNSNYESVYGTIVSNWKREGDAFVYHVEIPANTTATITLPVTGETYINGKEIKASKLILQMNANTEFELGSGVYTIECK
ncbi:glycoside hydrolase family 78 protein [Neptunitalea lumnitzerae]|uniref:alpha-L-rhamnosidase n=1 Tax=Neptunitalea lumnitzerae TaxID=2965509 RepID=A0ABQ5MJU8_9FLAO|nr:glycoside hydrolase family 78 protein [Neptunitalea sp. Y10]GLB49612.1 hydrolase [Neptunitalea sp. Y10]